MNQHLIVLLNDLLHELGEDKVKSVLSGFLCPLNKDVENFIKNTSINFVKQGIAATHLVFAPFGTETALVGYFSLANKCIDIPTANLSGSIKKRLSRFCPRNSVNDVFHIALPLIAQLGKNYANDFNSLISGDKLLGMAIDTIKEAQRNIGGRFAYLECEDIAYLKDFYRSSGFIEFSDRPLDDDDASVLKGNKLIRMIRYI